MKNNEYKIIYAGGVGEIVEKKSRFIASIIPVKNEQEAVEFISSKKKEYWDARHNCSAFVIGGNNEITRCSDDGEPAQTAGRPMLDVLLKENIHDCAVVVTRYFGGVLLGTGGLVRAYQGAVKEGLANCKVLNLQYGYPFLITTDYNGYGKIEYLLREKNLSILDTQFGENVVISSVTPEELKQELEKSIADKTAGSAMVAWQDLVRYALVDGQLVLF